MSIEVEKTKVCCHHCQREDLVKNGKAKSGRTRYYCRSCKRYGTIGNTRFYDDAYKEKAIALHNDRVSLRGISRQLGIARDTISSWIKKKDHTPSGNNALAQRA